MIKCALTAESFTRFACVYRYNRNNISSRSDSLSDGPSDNEIKGSMDIHPDMDFGLFVSYQI